MHCVNIKNNTNRSKTNVIVGGLGGNTDCVTASSVNMFKNKIDTYLRRAGYK